MLFVSQPIPIFVIVIYSTVRDMAWQITVIDEKSDTDISFGLFDLFTYIDMPVGW